MEVDILFIFLIIFIEELKTRIKPFYLNLQIMAQANESALRSALSIYAAALGDSIPSCYFYLPFQDFTLLLIKNGFHSE